VESVDATGRAANDLAQMKAIEEMRQALRTFAT
jgi:hypothetical protein